MGPEGQKSTFSKHGHVAFQIDENRDCSNMVENILPAEPLLYPNPVDGISRSKFNFFKTWSCCISNKKRITNAAAWLPPPSPRPYVWGQ